MGDPTRSHKDSPKHELVWHVCRECHHIQHCVVLRGWNVCRTCIERIDKDFCSKRCDELFKERHDHQGTDKPIT